MTTIGRKNLLKVTFERDQFDWKTGFSADSWTVWILYGSSRFDKWEVLDHASSNDSAIDKLAKWSKALNAEVFDT